MLEQFIVQRLYKCQMKELTGNGFLYNMVRIIAGTLVEVGSGKIKPEEIKSIIEAKDRAMAGKTLPPQGLFLVSVNYER